MLREESNPNSPGAQSRHVFIHQTSKCDAPGWIPGKWLYNVARVWSGERTLKGTQAPFMTFLQATCPNPAPYQYLRLIRLKDQITLYASGNGTDWRHAEGWTLDSLAASVEIGMVATGGNLSTTGTATFTNVSLKPLSVPVKTTWFGNSLPGGQAAVAQSVQAMHVNASNDRVYLSTFWDEATAEGSILTSAGTYYGRFDAIHGFFSGYAVTTSPSYAYIGVWVPGVDPADPSGSCDADSGWPLKPNVRFGIRRYDLKGAVAPFETCTAYCDCTNGYDGSIRTIVEVPYGTCSNNSSLPCDENADCGAGNTCNPTDRHIRGLAWDNSTLYASDTQANIIRMFSAGLTSLGDFPASTSIPKPAGLAVAVDHSLWVVSDNGGQKKILHYASNGTKQSQELSATGWNPKGLAIGSGGVIWVADSGPDMNIKKFNSDGSTAGTFGDTGGISSGTRGVVAPFKFNMPVAVGFDSGWNIYVAADGGTNADNDGGAEIRKFNAAGTQKIWDRYGVEFVDAGDADPTSNGKDIYTMEGHYTMDFSQSTGQEWAYKATTYDWASLYDDIRAHLFNNGGAGGVYLRRGPDGKRYLFATSWHGTFLGVHRFASDTSETAIPASLFASKHTLREEGPPTIPESPSWPTNQPQEQGGKPWIWADDDGAPNGLIASTEYEEYGVNETVRQWYVDAAMDVWAAILDNSSAAIRRYVLQSITNGVPVYSPSPSATVTFAPSTLNEWTALNCTSQQATDLAVTTVKRLAFDSAAKDMYVTVFTADKCDMDPPCQGPLCYSCDPDPYVTHDWQAGGRELRKYSNWDGNGTGPVRKLQWRAVLPWGGDLYPNSGAYHNVTSIAFAGSRVFANIMDTGEILVYDMGNGGNACTDTRSPLKTLVPGPEIAGKTGWFDMPTSMNAFRRGNGDYLVFAEKDLQAKGLVYRDPGSPLYFLDFEGATNFTLTNPSSGGTTPSYPTIGGSKVIKFRDTNSGGNKTAIYQNTVNTGALLARINQVFAQSAGSPPVIFEMNFTLERAEASNQPQSASITAGIILNKVGGGSLNPTGTPSIFNTLAYSHDESAGSEMLELVDRSSVSALRFTITPNGGATVINTINFQFEVRVGGSGTPEAYYVDNLTAIEVAP
jgi:hypothetical protein